MTAQYLEEARRERTKRRPEIAVWSVSQNNCQQQRKLSIGQATLGQLSRLFAMKVPIMPNRPIVWTFDGNQAGARSAALGSAAPDSAPSVSEAPNLAPSGSALPDSDAPKRSAESLVETDRDAVIMSVAAKQHGVVSRRQLMAAGLPGHAIDYRAKRRRLHRLYRGVYRVGGLRADYEKETAAVLAGGEAAVLSHRSAAGLWRMLRRPPDGVPLEITLRWGRRRSTPRLRVYRFARLEPHETTQVEGIPVTVPARTLLDLAGSVHDRRVEQALAVALRERLTTEREIGRFLASYPGRSGTPLLRALISRDDGPAFTRSEAEARFLELVRRARLPKPSVNVSLEGYEVDFLWRRERLIVEVDGFAFHSSSNAFERDRRRDALLTGAGFRVVRVTWRQLTKEREALLVRLGQALARTTP